MLSLAVNTTNYGFDWNNRNHRNPRYNTFGAFFCCENCDVIFYLY